MSTIEVKVPDIGDFADIPIIEIFVKPGDTVKAEDSLVTLESDKATMDVPSPSAGVIRELKVKVGDKVSEGRAIVVLDTGAAASDAGGAVPAPAACTCRPLRRRRRLHPLPRQLRPPRRSRHPPPPRSTARRSRPRTRRRRCASSRASWAWISRA